MAWKINMVFHRPLDADGTHIPIVQPSKNPHDYFSYKLKYTLNVQGGCDWKWLFLDVDMKWPGSVHDGRVFGT